MDLITLKDGAVRLKISRSTLWRLLKKGMFKKYHVGEGVRLDWEQVKEVIKKDVDTK